MTQKWYGASQAWPAHGKPWFDDALALARQEGWHLLTFSGHSFGKVTCSRLIEDPCEKLIFSTGRGGENHAKDLVRLINRCKHPRDDEPPYDYGEVHKKISGIKSLLDAAEICLDDQLAQAAAEDLLGVCEDALEDVDELLNEVIEAEEAHHKAIIDIYGAAARAGYPPDNPHTPAALIDSAQKSLTEVEAEVEAAAPSSERAKTLDMVMRLRNRLTALRMRLV